MTPERWRQVTEVFHAALARDASSRAQYVDAACSGDRALRKEVDAMLAAHHDPGEFGGRTMSGSIDDERRLETGAMIGLYRIERLIGAGGMGEVYRARDTKLGRDVAIKVLPRAFTSDPERLARFEREARMLASLNHPHIGAIYGFEETDPSTGSGQAGVHALVLELVEGPTLEERLGDVRRVLSGPPRAAGPKRPGLQLAEALSIARQIADALEAAHEHGIIHRDLKPANIKVTPEGVVKVLDFGLAKAFAPVVGRDFSPAGAGSEDPAYISQSPTMTATAVRDGVILGTPAYMSPEQARGQVVDTRTDIWAFGAILYEMLSGRRAFRGETTLDTMTAILKEDPPDLREVDRHIPPALVRIVNRCLAKRPAARFQTASDLAFALEGLSPQSERSEISALAPPIGARRPRERSARTLVAAASVGAVLATSALVVVYWRRPITEPGPVTFLVAPPENTTFNTAPMFLTVSPDGSLMAFVVTESSGVQRLWSRPFTSLSAGPLEGTEGATLPFWSPDSRFLAFFADGKLKKVAVTGGPPQTLCDAPGAARSGTWNRDGVILFTPTELGPIYRVSAGGGTPAPVTKLDQTRQENAHLWPHFLPDGNRFLYFASSVNPELNGIYVKALHQDDVRLVVRASSNVAYVSPGYLVYHREGTLIGQRFDATRAETTGDPFPIAERVDQNPFNGRAAFAVSETGVLAYRSGAAIRTSRLVWRDRNGKELGVIGQPGTYRNPRLSPDGTRIVVEMVDGSLNRDLWLADVARGTLTRFTFGSANESAPV